MDIGYPYNFTILNHILVNRMNGTDQGLLSLTLFSKTLTPTLSSANWYFRIPSPF